MIPSVLLVFLALLQLCVAPAIPATAHSAFPLIDAGITSTSDAAQNTCMNIENCQILVHIIARCLGTPFACVWVVVHHNIPGPPKKLDIGATRLSEGSYGCATRSRMLLAWAAQQCLTARLYAQKLEAARLRAKIVAEERLKTELA